MLYAWGKRACILIFLPFDTYIFTLLTSVFRDGGKVTSARAKLFPGCHSYVQNLPTQEKNTSTNIVIDRPPPFRGIIFSLSCLIIYVYGACDVDEHITCTVK